jgi:hypothetical protein
VPTLCDKIMGEKFRAVFLQYRLLKFTNLKKSPVYFAYSHENTYRNKSCLVVHTQYLSFSLI